MDYVLFAQILGKDQRKCNICSQLLIQRRCNLATYQNLKHGQDTIVFFHHDLFYCADCKSYYIRRKSLNKFQNKIGRKVYTKPQNSQNKKNENRHCNCHCIMTMPIVRTQNLKCRVCESNLESKTGNIGLREKVNNSSLTIGKVKICLPYCVVCKKYQISKNDVLIPNNILNHYEPMYKNERIFDRYELISLIRHRLNIPISIAKPNYDFLQDNIVARITLLNLECELERTYFVINEDNFDEDGFDEDGNYLPNTYYFGNLMSNESLLYYAFLKTIKDNMYNIFDLYEIIGYEVFKNIDTPHEKKGDKNISCGEIQCTYKKKDSLADYTRKILEEYKKKFGIIEHIDLLPEGELQPIYLCFADIGCQRNDHVMESILAHVATTTKDDYVIINVTYCAECGKCFIRNHTYQYYLEIYGDLLIKPIKYGYSSNDSQFGYENLPKTSEIFEYGYSVDRDIPLLERQKVLVRIIEFGYMSKTEVDRVINNQIEFYKNNSKHAEANIRRKEDLAFINDYEINRQRSVFGYIITKAKNYGFL